MTITREQIDQFIKWAADEAGPVCDEGWFLELSRRIRDRCKEPDRVSPGVSHKFVNALPAHK